MYLNVMIHSCIKPLSDRQWWRKHWHPVLATYFYSNSPAFKIIGTVVTVWQQFKIQIISIKRCLHINAYKWVKKSKWRAKLSSDNDFAFQPVCGCFCSQYWLFTLIQPKPAETGLVNTTRTTNGNQNASSTKSSSMPSDSPFICRYL